jgi:hypothetical protein
MEVGDEIEEMDDDGLRRIVIMLMMAVSIRIGCNDLVGR